MMEGEVEKAQDSNPPTGSEITFPRWFIASALALVLGGVYLGVAHYQAQTESRQQWQQTSELMTGLETRLATLEHSATDLNTDLVLVGERVGVTEKQLAEARAQARRLRQEHGQVTQQLNSELAEHEKQLESLTGEVSGVKGAVAETQASLTDTQGQLQRTVGDLGLQSGLIARNWEELEELKRRGERDYLEFDLRRSREFVRLGDVAVRLARSDAKRNRYTLVLMVNDKIIEKRDKTLLEPVQFYPQSKGRLLEIVVFELEKDRVAGYLSLPKTQVASR